MATVAAGSLTDHFTARSEILTLSYVECVRLDGHVEVVVAAHGAGEAPVGRVQVACVQHDVGVDDDGAGADVERCRHRRREVDRHLGRSRARPCSRIQVTTLSNWLWQHKMYFYIA